jgi:phage N-6-adenine-methyltransferase
VSRKPPPQKPGKSKQDYETPDEFIRAVEARFGPLNIDLAAREDNTKVKGAFIPPEVNSLEVDWRQFKGNGWLNPEFSNISPWVERASRYAGPSLKVFVLVPAAVGSNWYAEHVHGKALVLALAPRMVFVGEKQGYIKDLILCCYGFGVTGFDLWVWKENKRSRRKVGK